MIVVTGGEGMLGKAVTRLVRASGEDCLSFSHWELDVADNDSTCIEDLLVAAEVGEDDVLINCAGIRQDSRSSVPEYMARVNAVAPHVLARITESLSARMIHVSTDCVYSNSSQRAPVMHRVGDPTAPSTLYGRTKLTGEPLNHNVTVVRTSFVGPDHGLWKAVADTPQGGSFDGWMNAWWSGSTVNEVAKALIALAHSPRARVGVEHVATRYPISKLEAVRIIAKHLDRPDILINPVAGPRVDRSMVPTYEISSLAYALVSEAMVVEV